MSEDNKWLLRSETGKIQGPLSTREILLKIKKNEVDGTESISKYPGGSWKPISHNSDFYDYLLSHFSRSQDLDDDETNWDVTPIVENEVEEEIEDDDQAESLALPIIEEIEASVKKETPVLPTKEIKTEKPKKKYDYSRNIFEKEKTEQEQPKPLKNNSSSEIKKKNKKIKKPQAKKSSIAPILIVIILGFAGYMFLGTGSPVSTASVEIKGPEKDQPLDPTKVKELADKGVELFLTDTFTGYVKAQDLFVKVLEADKSYGDIYSLLCITHLNLWPFGSDNSKNLKIVLDVVNQVRKYQSNSLNYHNCNNSYLILNNEKEVALNKINSVIDQNENSDVPPTISYYLKSLIMTDKKKYEEAYELSSLVDELWPDWMAASFLKAQLSFKMDNKDQAISSFKNIIKKNQKNKKVHIYIGAMRNKFFKQYDTSINEISSALTMKGRVDNKILGIAHYYIADSYMQLGDSESAQEEVKIAYHRYPTDKKIENLYVNFFGEQGEDLLSDLTYLEQGDDLYSAGDYNSAQAYYKQAIKVNNKNTTASIKAAKSLEKLNLGDESVSILKNSLQVNPESVKVAVLLSQFYLKQFKYKDAFEVLNVTHKKVRGHYKIYLQFAELELKQGHYLSAIKYADKSLKIYGDNINALVIKGRAYLSMFENKKAYSELTKALNIDANNIAANKYFMKTYYRVHGIDSAIRKMKKLIATNESIVDYHLAMAEIYYEDEQFTQAERKYQQIIQIDENYQAAYLGIADAYKQMGQLNESKDFYFKAAKVDLQNSEPQLKLGLLYLETKKYKKAIKQFKNIIAINENYPKARYYYARSLFYLKKYKLALEEIKREKFLRPNNVDSYLLSGEIYEILGQYQLCKREFQQALKYRDFGSSFYLMVSRCHRKSGSLPVALNMLEKAKELSPNLPDIYRELGAVYEAQGNRSKAIWSYERYMVLSPSASDSAQINTKIRSLSN